MDIDGQTPPKDAVPFEGVGRPFRSGIGGEVADVRMAVNDFVGSTVLAIPQRESTDLDWFTGHVVVIGTSKVHSQQLQLVAREEIYPNSCFCAQGYGHYKLTFTDRKRRLRAFARVARTGGDCVSLEPRDASGVQFEATKLYSDAAAARLVDRFFPSLARNLAASNNGEGPVADAIVNSGVLRAKQLLFTAV